MARSNFGGRRAIIVKRGTPCPAGRVKKVFSTRTNPRVEMCLVRGTGRSVASGRPGKKLRRPKYL